MNLLDRADIPVVVLAITAVFLLVSQNWRWSIAALAIQYLAAFWLVVLVWPIELAVVKLIVGWMAGAVLSASRPEEDLLEESVPSFARPLFRVIASGLMLALIVSILPLATVRLPVSPQVVGGGINLNWNWVAPSRHDHTTAACHPGYSDSSLRFRGDLCCIRGFDLDSRSPGDNYPRVSAGRGLPPFSSNDGGRSMSAPVIWVVLPLVAAIGLWFLQKRLGLVVVLATSLCLLLGGLAFLLPFEETLRLGPLSLRIEPVLTLVGRRLVLDQADRPILTFFYTLAAFWFTGTLAAGGSRILVPFGLAIVAVLVAAMAVEPELYAALLIEGAVLISVPMLLQPGQQSSQGVLRYLIFQSLAMPMFILGNWSLAGVAANPTDANLLILTAIFLGFGFAFWLAVFPLYTWVPLLSSQSHPYAVGFIFMFFPTTILLLGLGIFGANGWLRSSSSLFDILRLSGALMIITAGLWAAFQRDLGRLLGYVVIVQTGFSLLALSLGSRLGDEIFVMMFLPRMVALGLWVLSASVLSQNSRSLHYSDIEQIAGRVPVAAIGVSVSFLSLAGLPLLAEFPIRFVLLQEIAVNHPIAALGILLGSLGLSV